MSIEIKQLLVRSNIVQKRDEGSGDMAAEQAALAKKLLEQCRSLILEMMNENRER